MQYKYKKTCNEGEKTCFTSNVLFFKLHCEYRNVYFMSFVKQYAYVYIYVCVCTYVCIHANISIFHV